MDMSCAVSTVQGRLRGADLFLAIRGEGFRRRRRSAESHFRHSCRRAAFVVASAWTVAAICPAHASTVNFYDVQIFKVTPPDITATSSSKESASDSGTTAVGSYAYSVLAGPGVLGDSNSVTAASTTGDQGDVRSNTNFTMSNIILTGPAGSAFVYYSVNFDVTGSFLLAASGNATATGIVEVDYDGSYIGGALASTNASQDGASGVFQGQTASANSKFDFAASTQKNVGENGAPITVTLNLATDANVKANDGSGSASVDFLDPLSFPSKGPVFNFFDLSGNPVSGWLANSSDGCIVNNIFMCGPGSPAGSVPELSTWTMALAGFGCLGLASYWRSEKRQAPPAQLARSAEAGKFSRKLAA